MKYLITAACLLVVIACSDKPGQPETETTGTTQAVSETTTASATTTGVTGGTSSAMTPDDKEFVVKAGMAGLAEVQMGNLALQNASNAEVKAFAQRMVTDHSTANAELAHFATAKGVALPSELEGDPEASRRHLMSLSGTAFDKSYMEHMVADHEKAVADFDKASTSASDRDLKTWAGKTLPTLKEHLELAKSVARKL